MASPATADQKETVVAGPSSGCSRGAQLAPPSVVRKIWLLVTAKPVVLLTKSTCSTASVGPRLCRQLAPWSLEMSKPALPAATAKVGVGLWSQ
jgi:hypothetical protein